MRPYSSTGVLSGTRLTFMQAIWPHQPPWATSIKSGSRLVKRTYPSTPPSLVELGPLERRLLEAVWKRGNGTVRELIESRTLNVAYTTAMTTLNRLYHKHLLSREREGRAFRYKPRFTKEEMHRTVARKLIHYLLNTASTTTLPLSYLVEAVTEHDIQLLDELQRIVDQKRRHLANQQI